MKRIDLVNSINSFLEKIDLTPPDSAEHLTHLYADYVELMLLFSRGTIFTTGEVLDRFKEKNIINQVKYSEDQAQQNDSNERRIDEIFLVLEDRAQHYGSDYPFLFQHRSISFLPNLSERQKIYLYLLISSNLNIFTKYYSNLTTDFEEVSYQALVNFLPQPAIVKAFGKKTKYKGVAAEKIRKLANEVQVLVDEEALARISNKGKMERGLDIIGWFPFKDWVGNKLVVLAQCTCEKNWFKKQHEVKRYKNYFKFYRVIPNAALFIPYALVDFQRNGFYQGDELDETLLFERRRILNNLTNLDFFDKLDSKVIVDKCLELEVDIV